MMGTNKRLMACFCTTLLALALGLSACGGGSGSSASGGSGTNGNTCVAEVKEINGVNTRSFCGSASAQANVGGQAWSFQQGECETASGQFTVNIGRVILGTGSAADQLKQQYDYFGLTVTAAADGTYTGIATGNHQGKNFNLTQAQITISGGMKKGTFSGTSYGDNTAVSGSFSC
jgi:hypothetical protein